MQVIRWLVDKVNRGAEAEMKHLPVLHFGSTNDFDLADQTRRREKIYTTRLEVHCAQEWIDMSRSASQVRDILHVMPQDIVWSVAQADDERMVL